MSVKNLFLLDNEFALKHSRTTDSNDVFGTFPHRLAYNRRNNKSTRPYWDIRWRSAIEDAIRQLDVPHKYVNGGVFFKTSEAKADVVKKANEIYSA
ncbi:hypothetical protein [Asticcacaulis benevestitus]|uniref:hypothetical protein n=1 Tax=Asticcacaulis benevestitus TaxID=347481 RepID=UPI000A8271A2|nr:hypothetical protein [Asticcacaulis benevestitus]